MKGRIPQKPIDYAHETTLRDLTLVGDYTEIPWGEYAVEQSTMATFGAHCCNMIVFRNGGVDRGLFHINPLTDPDAVRALVRKIKAEIGDAVEIEALNIAAHLPDKVNKILESLGIRVETIPDHDHFQDPLESGGRHYYPKDSVVTPSRREVAIYARHGKEVVEF